MLELTLSGRRRGIRLPQHGHGSDRGKVERESLTATEPRTTDDLDLGELLVDAADAVHGFRAEHDLTAQFADLRFSRSRDRTNLSIAAVSVIRKGADR
jgi:hypothetical protein